MSESAHRHLDRDIPRSGVSPGDQEALRDMEDAIAAARSWVAGHEVPDIASRVMAALPGEAVRVVAPSEMETVPSACVADSGAGGDSDPSPAATGRSLMTKLREAARWVWTPRPLSVRPALAGTFALALLFVMTRVGLEMEPQSSTTSANRGAAAIAPPVYIQFRLDAAGASDVALAGTFTEWQPAYPLHESAPGVWTVTVPLAPGVHDYLFIVDGERWVPDPAATPVDDGFGGTNSRLLLTAPQSEA